MNDIITSALLLIGAVLGLFLWGADHQDVAGWLYQLLFGFEIGRMTFSLVDLVVGVLLSRGQRHQRVMESL